MDTANKNKILKNGMMTFHKGAIESVQAYSFIPYFSIARVWLGSIPANSQLLISGIFLIILFFLAVASKSALFIVLGLGLATLGVYLIYKFFNGKRYGLIIETSSGLMYSFEADNENFIKNAYTIVLDTINTREEYRTTGTYNFINGQFSNVAIGDRPKVTNNS